MIVKFKDRENCLTYALFLNKEYKVLYESEFNYLITNEVGNNCIVPKNMFVKMK
jgi:hypothetical protein